MNSMANRPQSSSQRSQAKLIASGNKRKLSVQNGEEIPGGLIIVRQQPSRSTSQPPASASIPPAKKFRAGSQPDAGLPTSKHIGRTPEIEEDVRAMEDEADRLRRDARVRATVAPSLRQEFHPTPRSSGPKSARKPRIVDTTEVLAPVHSDSPMIVKNKRLREGAMNAIRAASQEPEQAESSERGREAAVNGSGGGRGHRRTSSVNGRGKRISSSFEATGILSHPHNSISESSFFKHIDPEIPETERLRLLLTWCTSRSANSYASVPGTTLPPLSAEEAAVLNKVQENIQRMLADKQIDISPSSQSQPVATSSRANEQNVSNRRYEAQYSNEIRQMEQEHEVWKKANYHYETYFKKEQERLDKRKADISQRQSMSAKAKGKQKASDDMQEDWSWLPSEHHLPESQHSGFALAKSVLGLRASPSGPFKRESTRTRLGREEAEAALKEEYSDLPFNLDTLHTHVNAARATTNAAEAELDRRFQLLHLALAARSGDLPDTSRAGTASAATQILNNYVPPLPYAPLLGADDPHSLFRALARVDSARPPGQIGDGARRAAREVLRMEENGIAGSGERKLTEVPPTPKKPPGTPRRGSTPGRGNTPGR